MDKIEFTIRRAQANDYEAVSQIYSGRAVWGTLQLPFPSADLWRKRLAEPPEGTFNLLACVKEEVIGHLGLRTFPHNPRRQHVGQIGMAIRDDWQGKGAGTAILQAALELADQWLNLLRIELEAYTDNEPAIRLYKKMGFILEGTHHQFAYRAGQFVDVYAMARIRTTPIYGIPASDQNTAG